MHRSDAKQRRAVQLLSKVRAIKGRFSFSEKCLGGTMPAVFLLWAFLVLCDDATRARRDGNTKTTATPAHPSSHSRHSRHSRHFPSTHATGDDNQLHPQSVMLKCMPLMFPLPRDFWRGVACWRSLSYILEDPIISFSRQRVLFEIYAKLPARRIRVTTNNSAIFSAFALFLHKRKKERNVRKDFFFGVYYR